MSFIKNIITAGNYNKLKKEEEELRKLIEYTQKLNNLFEELKEKKERITNILFYERHEAIRNIAMAKNLIKRIKKNTKDNKQRIIKDTKIDADIDYISINIDTNLSFDDNLDELLSTTFNTLEHSLDKAFNELDISKDFSKQNLKRAATNVAAEVAVNLLVEAGNQIIQVNKKTITQRKIVKENLEKTHDSIANLFDVIPSFIWYINKAGEIAKVLNKHNQIFKIKYNEIYNEIYKEITIKTFLTDKIVCKGNNLNDVMNLLRICSNYSKVNKNNKM